MDIKYKKYPTSDELEENCEEKTGMDRCFGLAPRMIRVGGSFAVLGCILQETDEDNRFIASLDFIAEKAKVSKMMALSSLYDFEEADLISFKKTSGLVDIFVNPYFGFYGGESRKELLLSEYYSFKREKMNKSKEKSEETEDADN